HNVELFIFAHRERMVTSGPTFVVGIILKQRKINDPQKFKFIFVDQLQLTTQLVAKHSQSRTSHIKSVDDNKYSAARLPTGFGVNLLQNFWFKKLSNGRIQRTVFFFDPNQPFCAHLLSEVSQLVDV